MANPKPNTEGIEPYKWKPGQSGNPKGRPKRKSLEELVHEVLDEKVEGTDTTKREVLAKLFVDEMLKRKPYAMREVLKRLWPEIRLLEHTGKDGGPLAVTTWADLVRKVEERERADRGAGSTPRDEGEEAP